MNVQIMSDLHMELRAWAKFSGKYFFISRLDATDVDVLVLAGDIATKRFLQEVLEEFCDKYPQVIYVPGNHEYYGAYAAEHDEKIKEICAKLPNLHLLDPGKVVIDGATFVGAALWFRKNKAANKVKYLLGDFSLIGRFDPWVYEKNAEAIAFFEKNMADADVVVTHHLPSNKSTPARFASSPTNPFFVCNMEKMIKKYKPPLWIHGHTHDRKDYMIGNTRIIANPLGYPGEKYITGNFDKKLVIKIPTGVKC